MQNLIPPQTSSIDAKNAFVIYGAGLNGKFVYQWLKKYNIPCKAFIDKRPLNNYDNVPVYQLHSIPPQLKNLPIIVALVGDVFNALNDIRNSGFSNIFSMADFFIFMECQIKADIPNYYLLGQSKKLSEKISDLENTKSLFKEEKSREIFCRFINYKSTGNFEYLMNPDSGCEYYPDSRPFNFKQPVSYIDCGAFTGDSIESLAKYLTFDSIIAFEPDPDNFLHLKSNITYNKFKCPVIALQKGVSAKQSTSEFLITGSMYSMGVEYASMNQQGVIQQVQLDSIDNIFSEYGKIDFIKMDVEGFEIEALTGSQKTINRYQPVLAVSVYHKPCDIWEIPEYIHKIYPEAELFLRVANDSFHDTICYAVPTKFLREQNI